MTALLAMSKGDRIFDGINHPTAATVLADNLIGALLYCGTPHSGKDFTAVQYADYVDHGLWRLMCYENVADDIAGGATAGIQHAQAFIADARAKHVDFTDPALAAVDEHVAVARLPLAVAYQRAFRNQLRAQGWRGPIGAYGFPETLNAFRTAGVADFYFGAGRAADQPAFVNIWQDNTTTILVGGSADDQDWVRIPLPRTALTGAEDMAGLTDPMPPIKMGDGNEYHLTPMDVLRGLAQFIGGDVAEGDGTTGHPVGQYLSRILAIDTINANVAKIAGALPANQAALLAAIDAHDSGATTIADMETAFEAVLGGKYTVTLTPADPAVPTA